MIEVLSTPPLNTVQDLGRKGSRRHGVSTSGVMDRLAFLAGNILLGNSDDDAGIEVQTYPLELRFLADAAIALTGADCAAKLDSRALPPWWRTTARAGQRLKLHAPRIGCRAYLTFRGGLDVPEVLGSRSTHLRSGFGGFKGRSLENGDIVGMRNEADAGLETPCRDFGAQPPELALPGSAIGGEKGSIAVRALKAGDYDLFPPAAQALFWQSEWKISHLSDRGGYRLLGPQLLLDAPVEMRSYGIVAGIVQIPPSGEPIIQLSDANTAGGYPKIATVIEADLWRLGQARLGSSIRFVEIRYADAVKALEPNQAYLAQLRRLVDLNRDLQR